jgi:hypothetical protein
MTILSYRNFFIVTRSNGAVDLINPHNERVRVVKSVGRAELISKGLIVNHLGAHFIAVQRSVMVKQSTSLQGLLGNS